MTQTANSAPNVQKNQVSVFRHWVQELWMQNRDEHLTYKEDTYTIKQYWDKYKYWLKREFKYQQRLKND